MHNKHIFAITVNNNENEADFSWVNLVEINENFNKIFARNIFKICYRVNHAFPEIPRANIN